MKIKLIILSLLTGLMTFSSCKKEEVEQIVALFEAAQFEINPCSDLGSLSSSQFTPSTHIYFDNQSGETLKIYWIDFSGELQPYHTNVTSGTGVMQQTYLTHPWYITTDDEECVTIVTALQAAATDTVTFVKED